MLERPRKVFQRRLSLATTTLMAAMTAVVAEVLLPVVFQEEKRRQRPPRDERSLVALWLFCNGDS
jgi:hypothetical protein